MRELVVWKGFAARRDRIVAMGLSVEDGELVCRVVVDGLGPVLLKEKDQEGTLGLYLHGLKELQGLTEEMAEVLGDFLREDFGFPVPGE